MARLAWAFLRRDFLLEISYLAAFAMGMVGIAFAVPIMYYVSQLFKGVEPTSLGPYGGGYFPFLLLGIAFQDYVTFSQSAFNKSIREHQLMGTLEIVVLSPTPLPLILLCSSLWGYVSTSLRFWIFLLLGATFGLDLSKINLLSFVLVTVLAVASFSALGILTASLVVIIKRGGEALIFLLCGATVALSGVLYPVSILPSWLQTVSKVLPFTHGLAGMRKAILLGASPGALLPELSALVGFAAVLFPLGLWAFALAIRRTKVTGTLAQY